MLRRDPSRFYFLVEQHLRCQLTVDLPAGTSMLAFGGREHGVHGTFALDNFVLGDRSVTLSMAWEDPPKRRPRS